DSNTRNHHVVVRVLGRYVPGSGRRVSAAQQLRCPAYPVHAVAPAERAPQNSGSFSEAQITRHNSSKPSHAGRTSTAGSARFWTEVSAGPAPGTRGPLRSAR